MLILILFFSSEIQLKPQHKLLTVFQKWSSLEEKYCIQTKKIIFKEPILSFQRNVFFPRKDEEKIKWVYI
jgi:hypothetical protein